MMVFLPSFCWQTFALENDFESLVEDCMRVLVENSDEALGVGIFGGSDESDEPTLQELGRVSSEAMAAFLQQPEVALSDEYEVWQGLLRWARLFSLLLSSFFLFLFFLSSPFLDCPQRRACCGQLSASPAYWTKDEVEQMRKRVEPLLGFVHFEDVDSQRS